MASGVNAPLRLISALDDPLRLTIVRALMAGGMTVSELIARSGAAQSKVSNHLGLLREAGIVESERVGRNVTYRLANPELAAVIEAIEAATGPAASADATPEIALARSCYDHVAGRLGVALFRSLVDRGALRDVESRPSARKVRAALGDVALGPRAGEIFAACGIDVESTEAERRRFAAACNDWTESRPHLGGALGAALQQRLMRLRWIARRSGTRALRITPAGRDGFAEWFGIDVEALSAAVPR